MKQPHPLFTPTTPSPMPEPNDYKLTYPEVQQMLGVSRRSVQALVTNGKLHKKLIQGPNGQQAFFSESEVRSLMGVKQTSPGGEAPQAKLVRYETGITFFQQMIKEKEAAIAKQDQEIKQLLHDKGKLSGSLEEVKAQLERQRELKNQLEHYKHRATIQPLLAIAWLPLVFFLGWLLSLTLSDKLSALFGR